MLVFRRDETRGTKNGGILEIIDIGSEAQEAEKLRDEVLELTRALAEMTAWKDRLETTLRAARAQIEEGRAISE